MSETTHPNPKVRWQNRRRLAYLSFGSALTVILSLIICGAFGTLSPEYLSAIVPAVSTFMFGCFSIVGAYVGFATFEEIKNRL